MKWYLNTITSKIGQYNGVSGEHYIELTAEQVERYNNWVSNIGGSIPNNWVLTGEGIDYNSILTEKQLREAKSSKLSELQTNYKSKLDEGYTYNSFTFNLDENTKGNIGDWISLNTISGGAITDYYITVSYTHLTLPTKRIV